MLIIYYLSGVEKYIVDIFKNNYKSAQHVMVDSVFHYIDQENILNPGLNKPALNKQDQRSYLIVQSFKSANDHFMELINILLQINNRGKVHVFLLYMAYGHRRNGVKNFMLESIDRFSHNIIALDINKAHCLVKNIAVQDVLYHEFIDLNLDGNILIAIDYRSLEVVKNIAKKTGVSYLFLNKHCKDKNYSFELHRDIIDDGIVDDEIVDDEVANDEVANDGIADKVMGENKDSGKLAENSVNYNNLYLNNLLNKINKSELNIHIIDDVLYTGASIISAMGKINQILDVYFDDYNNEKKLSKLNKKTTNINLYITHKLQKWPNFKTLNKCSILKSKDKLQGKDGLQEKDELQGKDGLQEKDELQGKDGRKIINFKNCVLNNHYYEQGDEKISWKYILQILDKYMDL